MIKIKKEREKRRNNKVGEGMGEGRMQVMRTK